MVYNTVLESDIGVEFNLSEVKYAGFWIRFIARILDGLIFSIFSLLLYLIVIGFNFSILSDPLVFLTSLWARFLLISIVSFLVYFFYYVFMNMRGATLGKIAFGLEIRREDNLYNISFGTAVGRFFALEFISSIVFGLGFIWAGWDLKKQTWHDKLAKTVVVYKDTISKIIHTPPPPEPTGKLFGQLVFTAGRMAHKNLQLRGNKVVIGRGEFADIRINDPDKLVSREQCEIFKQDSRYFLRNLSQKGGTRLNGKRLEVDRIALRENDEISFADHKMKIKFFN